MFGILSVGFCFFHCLWLFVGFISCYMYVFRMKSKDDKMDLSIIIPVLNEQDKVKADIDAAANFLRTHNIRGEILLVDDGSSDDTVLQAQSAGPYTDGIVRIIALEKNRGKGYAIRCGFAESSGKIVMFADSGLCIPFPTALRGMEMLNQQACQIVIGSRKLSDSEIILPQSLKRRISSWLFRRFTILFMGFPASIKDSQCGFKLFDGKTGRDLCAVAISDGFMLDIELILRARKQGMTVCEIPVRWTCDRDSRLSVRRSLVNVLRELWAIKRALRR